MLASLLLGAQSAPSGPPPPPPIAREFRAAWVATVDNIDWPSRKDLTVNDQRAELRRVFQIARQTGLNALVLQVRPSADALYASEIEPWSEFLTGRQGRAPSPAYDPLKEACALAREFAMELHVWINPYRAKHPAATGPLSANHLARTDPGAVVNYGRFQWMDPGQKNVQDRILVVTEDLVRRYPIDGVHIDDYFYPYPVAGQEFPDAVTFAAYQKGGGTLSRDDWRRDNVNQIVRRMAETIRRTRPTTQFGISPFGIYRPGVPAGIRAGIDQYAQLYADARLWLRNGWCDYFSPQLYWPIDQTPQAFGTLFAYWTNENGRGRHLWPGLYTSRCNPQNGNWPAKEITDQIRLMRARGGDGHVHFSMKALMNDWNGVRGAVEKLYEEPALSPASPWMLGGTPKAPRLKRFGTRVDWSPGDSRAVRAWVLQTRRGTRWTTRILSPDVRSTEWTGDEDAIAVTAVDAASNASSPARLGG